MKKYFILSFLLVTAMLGVAQPGAPTNLTITQEGRSATLSWTAPEGGAARYKIYRYVDGVAKDIVTLTSTPILNSSMACMSSS